MTTDTAPIEALAQRVAALAARLSPTEERLVGLLLQEPEFCAVASVGSIASRVGAHASALVRLAQKLGFEGFPELRAAVQSALFQRRRTDALIRERLADAGEGDILGRLIEREIAALQTLADHVSQPQLDAAARALLSARTVMILAEGTAEALARHAAHRLRRAGLVTLPLHPDPRAVAEGAALLAPDDAENGGGKIGHGSGGVIPLRAAQ